MSEDQLHQAFINWAKHLDSDGYFGALETFDEFILPMWRALELSTELHSGRCRCKVCGIRVEMIGTLSQTSWEE